MFRRQFRVPCASSEAGVALIGGFVLLEKIAPSGHGVSCAAGALLTVWGLWLFFSG